MNTINITNIIDMLSNISNGAFFIHDEESALNGINIIDLINDVGKTSSMAHIIGLVYPEKIIRWMIENSDHPMIHLVYYLFTKTYGTKYYCPSENSVSKHLTYMLNNPKIYAIFGAFGGDVNSASTDVSKIIDAAMINGMFEHIEYANNLLYMSRFVPMNERMYILRENVMGITIDDALSLDHFQLVSEILRNAENFHDIFSKIIMRIDKLRNNAKEMWKLFKDKYGIMIQFNKRQIIECIHKDQILADDICIIFDEYPEIIHEYVNIFKISYAQLAYVDIYDLSHILGLMNMSPYLVTIRSRKLVELGHEKYYHEVKQSNAFYFIGIIYNMFMFDKSTLDDTVEKVIQDVDVVESNGLTFRVQDTLFDSVFDYNICDVILSVCKTNIFFFTRPEFEYILKSRKNPWTNTTMQNSVLDEIQKSMNNFTSNKAKILKDYICE